jgi:phosphoribulokinase
MLGIVGDSGSGKTTITRGLVRVLGEDQVTHFCTDDYHRFDRRQRAERNITPLHPDCNHLDILAQHLRHLRANEPIMKPVYRHSDGTFGPPDYFVPGRFLVTEGLLAFYNRELYEMFDVRVYLDPPEELRRHWKVQRDCSRRGYTTDQVLAELDRREPDSEMFIRPQRHNADIVVSFQPTKSGVQELYVPGRIKHERAHEIEEAIWERMHFARHLREQRLGEFTIGTELHRSDSLAVVQLLILYHLVCARAAVAGGHSSPREMDESALADMVASTATVTL